MLNSRAEQRLHFPGQAGKLAGLFRDAAAGRTAPAAALLCHPHPLYGGTMHNKTLYRLAKRLPVELDIPCLRFDFRGAGGSEGQHDGGRGEADDARAALDELRNQLPLDAEIPLLAIGYSFGAAIGLQALAKERGLVGLVALGLPLGLEWDVSYLLDLPHPCLVVQGEHDEFGNGVELSAFAARRKAPTEVHIVPGASHLFTGVEDQAVDAVVEYLARHFPRID